MTQSDYLSRRFRCRERARRFYREANDLIDRREFFGTIGGLESCDPKMIELQDRITRLQARAGAMERQASKLYRLAYPPVDALDELQLQKDNLSLSVPNGWMEMDEIERDWKAQVTELRNGG